MNKILQCPHFISYGGLTEGCLLGYSPVNCESCNCPDKCYIELITSSSTSDYDPQCSNNIEYVRKDDFIEKAENYLRNKCQRFILTEKDIEDFVNYMKGE